MAWLSKVGKSVNTNIKFHAFESSKFQNEGRGVDPEKERGLDAFETVIQSTRYQLLEVCKSISKWSEKGTAFYKQNALWGETLSKAKLEGENAPTVEGFTQAIVEISKLQQHISDLENAILVETQTKLFDNLNTFINTSIKGRKVTMRKYQKSRQDYETLTAKAKQLGSSKKIDVLKLYTTEKEKEKARKIMEANRREHMEYLEDMQARLITDVLDMLIASGETHAVQLGQGYAEISALWEYLEKLKEWCGKEEEFHNSEIFQREAQWVSTCEADEAQRIMPLIELLCHPSLTLLRCLRESEKSDLSLQYSHSIAAFVRLLDVTQRVVPCLVAVIITDITSNAHGTIMFHTNPTALEMFLECSRVYGGDYVKGLLEPIILNLQVASGSFSGMFVRSGSAGRQEVNNAEGVAKVVALLETIMTALINSAANIPPFHLAVMNAVRQDCPRAQVFTVLNMYLLGRVIAPALQEPHKFGVTKDPVTESARGCLYFMGQFFHIFSNNETFPAPPNSPMTQLNELIAKWRDPLDSFWDKLQSAPSEVPSITPGSTAKQELATLQASLKDYYPTICTLLVGGQPGPGGSGSNSPGPTHQLSHSPSGGSLSSSGGAMSSSGGVSSGLGGEEGKANMEAFSSSLALLEPDVRIATFADRSNGAESP